MKQKFKGQSLTLSGCVKNILKVYNSSDKFISDNWYYEANKYAQSLSNRFNVPLSVACGIIAALSPLKTWEQNQLIAYSFLDSGKGKHTKAFLDKCRAIKASNGDAETIALILNGNKTISFFINILAPEQSEFVTIDRHAVSIAIGRSIIEAEGRGITFNQYDFFVNAYKLAANKAGISPVLMQSITWQQWRQAKGIKENDVPF